MESIKIEKDIVKLREQFQEDISSFQTTLKNIKRNESEDAYYEKVKELGFVSVDGLKEFETKNEKISQKHSMVESIRSHMEHYNMYFPQYFIIPLKNMIMVAEKYNLVFGPSVNFKELIPMKNLEEIEDFNKHLEKYFKMDTVCRNIFENQKSNVILIEPNSRLQTYQYGNPSYTKPKLFLTAPVEQFLLGKSDRVVGSSIVNDKDFNLWDSFKEEKESAERRKIMLRDPIVWTPVKFPMNGGACMIITKWGEEAKYPEFANPKSN